MYLYLHFPESDECPDLMTSVFPYIWFDIQESLEI